MHLPVLSAQARGGELLRSGNHYAAALALTFLSGAVALAHQLLWVRLMVDVLGAGAGTFARVTGSFFLGLSLGSLIASKVSPRRPWLATAIAEAGAGTLAGIVLLLAFHPALTQVSGWLAIAMEWGLPFVLILPPATAMGLVLPWVVGALATDGVRTARLYAVNTAGAVAGVLLVIGWALPSVGLRTTGLIAIAGNFLIAGGCLLLSRGIAALPNLGSSAVVSRGTAALAFASGFLVLGQEVVLQEQFSQVTINSLFSSAGVLSMVLVLLALAAVLAPLNSKVSRGGALSWVAGLAVIGCAVQPLVFTFARSGLVNLPYQLAAWPYMWEFAKLGLLVVTPVILFAGMVFPLLIESARGNAAATGRLLAWNGLGGLLGAELTSAVIAPVFGLWQSMTVLACGYLAVFASRGPRWAGAGLTAIVTVSAFICAGLPQAGLESREKLADVRVGREGVVGVVRRGPEDWRIIFNNTYTLGGSRAQFNQERQAHLPLLLHGNAKSVATLGVATGSTLAGAAAHSGVERLDAIELSPLVARFASKYFGVWNRGVFSDPRVHLVIGDARWVVARNPAAYDVVIGDLFLPWRTGEGRLFTREHFINVKRSLTPDGIFCQWLPLYQLTREQYDVIVRTFLSVFPDSFLIRGDFYREQPIVGLVGGRKLESIDWSRTAAACDALRQSGRSSDPLVTHIEGVIMLLLGRPPALKAGPINTLANAWLEWEAGHNIIGLRQPWFAGDAFMDYAETVASANRERIPGGLASSHAAGSKIARLQNGSVSSLLPSALRDDIRADWRHWPGKSRPYQQ